MTDPNNSPRCSLHSWRSNELLASEFIDEEIRVIDLHLSFHDSIDMHGDGARYVVLR